MARLVSNEEELGQALKAREYSIEIEGDLKDKVFKIKATGNAIWVVAIAAIAAAVTLVLLAPGTGGTSAIAGIAALTPAVGILGTATAVSAVLIAVGGGGIGILSQLRKYKLSKLPNGHVLLTK